MIIGTIFLILILAGSLLPQDNRGQAEQGIVLPVLKQKGRMNRAIGNLKSFTLTGIAYAKSLGKTPEDYGKFAGELYAPFWTVRKGSVAQIVRGIYFNRQMNRNFKLEILSESETSVKARWKEWIDLKGNTGMGVTGEEYARFLGKIYETISNHLELEWQQEFEDDWLVFTVTIKN